VYHRPRRWHKIRLADVMPFLFFRHYSANKFYQLFVASAAAHLGVQIVVPYREQAGADLSVAGDAYSATPSAERMRDGRDDADLADAVVEAVAAGGFRMRVRDLN
jgi:hypothetical protein